MEINQPSLAWISCNCKGYFGSVSAVVKNTQESYFPRELQQTIIKELWLILLRYNQTLTFFFCSTGRKGRMFSIPLKMIFISKHCVSWHMLNSEHQWRRQHCNSHILIWQLGRKYANVQLVGYYCCSFSQGKISMHIWGWLLYKELYKLGRQLNFLAVYEKAFYFLLYSQSGRSQTFIWTEKLGSWTNSSFT